LVANLKVWKAATIFSQGGKNGFIIALTVGIRITTRAGTLHGGPETEIYRYRVYVSTKAWLLGGAKIGIQWVK
jgi:hypothetical protein